MFNFLRGEWSSFVKTPQINLTLFEIYLFKISNLVSELAYRIVALFLINKNTELFMTSKLIKQLISIE